MHGFTQYTPTRIIFGKETQKQAGELAKSKVDHWKCDIVKQVRKYKS